MATHPSPISRPGAVLLRCALSLCLLSGAVLLPVSGARGQADPPRAGVPAEYAGDWVCQSAVPGYNLPVPVIPGQAPSTGRMTTPPSTVVLKFTLAADGGYEGAGAKGHYAFHPAPKSIEWLDGPYRQQFSNTQVSRRSNGAPALSLHANNRYYGCFLAKASGAAGREAGAPAASEPSRGAAGGGRYTKEEFLRRARQGAKAYEQGDLVAARAIFEDLVEADPSSAPAHAALGVLQMRAGENEAALRQLSRSIELDPRELTAYVNRGELFQRLGRRAEAEADLKHAVALDPEHKSPAANRARALLHGTLPH